MTAGLEIAGVVLGASVPATAAIGLLLRPVRAMRKDLGPLIDRDSDGRRVWDELRAQQQIDTVTLAHLAAEFPKNGVPTRTAVDAIKLDLAEMRIAVAHTEANLAELTTTQEAHMRLHRTGRAR